MQLTNYESHVIDRFLDLDTLLDMYSEGELDEHVAAELDSYQLMAAAYAEMASALGSCEYDRRMAHLLADMAAEYMHMEFETRQKERDERKREEY